MKRLSSSAHNEVVLANFMQPAGTGRRTDQAAQIGTRLSSARSCARRQCGGDATDGSCHRRIIADYLIAAGDTVFHILGRKHLEQAHMTDAAKIGPCWHVDLFSRGGQVCRSMRVDPGPNDQNALPISTISYYFSGGALMVARIVQEHARIRARELSLVDGGLGQAIGPRRLFVRPLGAGTVRLRKLNIAEE